MERYRLHFRFTSHYDFQSECDADAMMEAREHLRTMQKINPKEEVWLWCKNPNSKTYRFVVAYK